jgi:hypothetical protein
VPGTVTAHEQHPRPLSPRPPAPATPGRTDPAAAVERRWRAVIRGEVRRLRRRRPGLTPDEIRAVETALDRIIDRLLLSRLRGRPPSARHLATLLDLGDLLHDPATGGRVVPDPRARPDRGRAASLTPDGDRDD